MNFKNVLLRDTLRKLLFEQNIRANDLAKASGVPQPTIQRILAGTSKNPRDSSLEPIAKYFKISLEQLKEAEPIECEDNLKYTDENTWPQNQIPIMSWDTPIHIGKNNVGSTLSKKVIIADSNYKKNFALEMNDTSMEPIFPAGSMLIFKFFEKLIDRSYVLVKIKDMKHPVFRQLIIDADDLYLKAINPDLSSFPLKHIESKNDIIGTLIESRNKY